MAGSLKWRGEELIRKVQSACAEGINATMSDCVQHAKRNHTWQNRQFTLEPSINIAEYARRDGSGMAGLWGSQDVEYARIHELGGVIRPVRAKALRFQLPDGTWRMATQVTIPPRPYLRPAADAIYPSLTANIRKALEKTFTQDPGLADAARDILSTKPTSND